MRLISNTFYGCHATLFNDCGCGYPVFGWVNHKLAITMKQLAKAAEVGATVDPRFQSLTRWSFLMMQIFECRTFLDLAENDHQVHPQSSLPELLTQQALFRSFLLAYGKCFASSGKGRSSLDAKKVFSGSEELSEIHRVVRTSHTIKTHVPIVIVETARGTDSFVISEMENVIRPNEQIRLVLRRGNLGFARFVRIERLSGKKTPGRVPSPADYGIFPP